MTHFTDLFIKRPVLATVVSLLIFFLGLKAIFQLNLREYPAVTNSVIKVTTAYPGANADIIKGFITTPLQQAIASADGIDYITSSSSQGISTITSYITLNFDPNIAFTSIMSKVAQVRNMLPPQSQQPVIQKDAGASVSLMYISFSSLKMNPQQITDYISRVVQPQLQTVPGVAAANILGANVFALRVWLDPTKMAAFHVSMADVMLALSNNNYQSAAGSTKGSYISLTVNAHTDAQSAQDFENLVVRQQNGALVRMKNIATIKLGSQSYDSQVIFDGQQAIFVGIDATPLANPLSVIDDVKKILPKIALQYPPSLHYKVVYDATLYISSSLHEVIKTIIEASLIVIIVIFLFLGTLRAVIIPVVTIPLSLIGVSALLLFLGYSLNLLTLLAMVLAIGMVVDDAIVVVENIFRHIEEGLSPFNAAILGAREIATPVISMTITLAAVYLPIGFMGGMTGSLFKEFAFTLASAVIISGVIALTLSPMMCSLLLNTSNKQNKLTQKIDNYFLRLSNAYQAHLTNTFHYRSRMLLFVGVVMVSIVYLYTHTKSELAPVEDKSVLFLVGSAQQDANIDYVAAYSKQVADILTHTPGVSDYFLINGMPAPNGMFGGAILAPWGQRHDSQTKINEVLSGGFKPGKFSQIAGLNTVSFPLPALPVSGGNFPIQFVLNTTSDFKALYSYTEQLKNAAQKSGYFVYVDSDLKFNNPQIEINIDKNKAGNLGINMQTIGNSLSTALSGAYLNYFSMAGHSYEVIPMLMRQARLNEQQLQKIYLPTATNSLVPLSTFATFTHTVQPSQLNEFQQLNSATISAMLAPGKTIGDGLKFLQDETAKLLPSNITVDYAGMSRQYIKEGNSLAITFLFALIVIYLVLAAQFESFRDPLIILITVPLSICGALIFLNIGFASINIYTQVGLITLIGLISKHGILMVEFANQLREKENLSASAAIFKSALIRLRPILMTTSAMVMGVVPLLFASGAGAVSRFDIGLVIITGMTIGTFFTLFVLPTIYVLLSHQDSSLKDDINEVSI